MPNILDASGLTVSTLTELTTFFQTSLANIYGADINTSSDTPDGQWIGIMAQAQVDIEDLLTNIYSTFDPDNAIGVTLDQRVSYNGIQRQAGTYTITQVTLVLAQSVNLYGLDQTDQQIFTVADNAGNLWLLETTQLGAGPGTESYSFRAATPGATLTVPNTITTLVTIVLGVSSCNNPLAYTSLGTNEESDQALRIRRQQSVSLASQGYYAGLLAALENINGVSSAFIYENTTGSTNVDGVPGHSIWVIVAGTGLASSIAEAIYTKRNAGCGMFGSTIYTITQVDGTPFNVKWDNVSEQNVFITFETTSLSPPTVPNVGAIREGLPSLFVPGVNQEINVNALATQVQVIDPNTLVTIVPNICGFTRGQTQIITFGSVAASGTCKINYNGNVSADINWNDSTATTQATLRAVPGLSAIVVVGSIAAQGFTFSLHVDNVLALLYVTDNTLQTSFPIPVTVAYGTNYTPTLTPSSKSLQLQVTSANIIIPEMVVLPIGSTVVSANTLQFNAYGGYATYTWSLSPNNSGGSIDSSGLYTAGATPGVNDTVIATDVLGNSGSAQVAVST